MTFEITRKSDQISEGPKQSQNETGSFSEGLPTSAIRSVAIPASRIFEGVGGLVGGSIEIPAALTSQIYSLFGKEPPEWAQGPSPLRISREGQIIPALRTPQEIREEVSKTPVGKYTEPTNVIEKSLSDATDIFINLRTGGVKGVPAIKGAAAAYGIRKGSEELGVPTFFSLPAEVLGTHGIISSSKVTPSSVTAQGKKLAETARQEQISSAPSAILSEGKKNDTSKFLRSVGVAGESVREQAKQFVDEIENAYHEVLSTIHQPYATERNLKILREQAGRMFDPVKEMASQNPVRLNTTNLSQVVDRNISKIKKSKSLTSGEKQALTILEDFKKELQQPFTLENGEATYRSFNKHVKDWDSITKNDAHLINVKKAISDEMMDAGKNVPGFNDAFNTANIGYHNLSKLTDATQILKKAFTDDGRFDPHRFINTVRNKENRSELIGLLGKQSMDRMTNISELTKSAMKNFDAVEAGIPESLRSSNKQLGMSMGLVRHAVSKVLGEFPAKILTSPDLQKNYLGYVRSIRDNSPKMTAYYLRQIKKEYPEEFSEEASEGDFQIERSSI